MALSTKTIAKELAIAKYPKLYDDMLNAIHDFKLSSPAYRDEQAAYKKLKIYKSDKITAKYEVKYHIAYSNLQSAINAFVANNDICRAFNHKKAQFCEE